MNTRKARRAGVFAAGAVALFIHANPATAATFVVTRLDDPAPGPCAAGDCSLREAAIAANASSGSDRIELAAGTYTLQIAPGANDPATGDIDLTSADVVTLVGAGRFRTIIDANGIDRVFSVSAARFQDLAITGGVVSGDGGGILAQGAIQLDLERVRVFDNEASGFGGGIFAGNGSGTGRVTVIFSQIELNRAANAAGMVCAFSINCDLRFSTVRGNVATFQSAVTAQDVVSFDIVSSSIVGNTAGSWPAGFNKFGTGSIEVVRSTISGNVANGAGGGAMRVEGGLFSMDSSTVSNNLSAGADGVVFVNATTNLSSNVFDDPCQRIGGTVGFSAYNVETAGATCGLSGPTDRTNVAVAQVALGPLGDNAGWTPTHAPGAASILRGNSNFSGGFCFSADQRGTPVQPAECDTGSVQFMACREPAVPVAIPDNNPTGIVDQLVIDERAEITFLSAYVEITHSYVGDLEVELEHVDTGTRRTLLQRPLVVGTASRCSGDNVGIRFQDFQPAADSSCKLGTVAFDLEEYGPTMSLAPFAGESLGGTWRLHVRDLAGQDTGALSQWCVSAQKIIRDIFANGFE